MNPGPVHLPTADPDYESLADALDRFYGIGLIDCPRCKGAGEIQFNLSRNRDPQCDDSATCNVCYGDGMVRPDDLDNENDARAADTAGRHGHHETES